MRSFIQTVFKTVATVKVQWQLYFIGAGGLGVFMLIAVLADAGLEGNTSLIPSLVTSALLRRLLMGLAMGATAICLIYSPWGACSGAHFNPALTLTFACLGKIGRTDAFMYMLAQFIGGTLGVILAARLAGTPVQTSPVNYAVTVRGAAGVAVAFAMEVLISAILMGTTLVATNHPRLMRLTGLFCGMLIVAFVAFEAPYSGMSMNPARTVASSLPSGIWTAAWLYWIAPPLGMALAALAYRAFAKHKLIACAKLNHDTHHPCPFNCHFKAHGIHVPSLMHGVLVNNRSTIQ